MERALSVLRRLGVQLFLSLVVVAKPTNDAVDDNDVLSTDDSGSDGPESASGDSLPNPLATSNTIAPRSNNPHDGLLGYTKQPDLCQKESHSSPEMYSQHKASSNENGTSVPHSEHRRQIQCSERDFEAPSIISQDALQSHDDSMVQVHSALPDDATTLSSRNLSMDARVCRKPNHQRQNQSRSKDKKGDQGNDITSSNDEDASNDEEINADWSKTKNKGQLNDGKCKERSDIVKQEEDKILDFIRDYFNKAGPTEAEALLSDANNLECFDAAVVYDTSDYRAVNQFILDVKALVEERLKEKVRIELFDSVAFAQSKVLVVEDVINRCSIVFVYLTENCNQETFRLFCDEAIGITRLSMGTGEYASTYDQQWVLKPVHTQSPRLRRYKTPVGLVSLIGIDWFDKYSDHTRDRLVHIMEQAVMLRKRKENQKSSTHLDTEHLTKKMLRHKHHTQKEQQTEKSFSKEQFSKKEQTFDMSSVHEDALSFQTQNNDSIGSVGNHREAGHHYGYRNPTVPMPMQNPHGMYSSLEQSFQMQYNPQPNQPFIQINGQWYLTHQAGQQQTYPVAPNMNQNGIPFQNPGYAVNPTYPNAQQMVPPWQQVPQYNGQPQYQSQSGYPQQQSYNGHVPVIQSAGLGQMYPNQNIPMPPNRNMPMPPHQNIPNQQHTPSYPTQGVNHQFPGNSTYADAASTSGDYMRDRRNDAPSESELSVVSRLTGQLIVNPNLSTDDIEIDDPSGRGDPEYRPWSSDNGRTSGHRAYGHQSRPSRTMHRHAHSDDSSSSSDDSDLDQSLPRGHSKKGKVVNIIGGKNVQLGSNNRVVEMKEQKPKRRSTRKKSSEKECLVSTGPSMNSLKLSKLQEAEIFLDHRNAHSRYTGSTVHEDNLDMTSHFEDINPAQPETTHSHDKVRDYLGNIDCDIYHRRKRLSQTQVTDEPCAATSSHVTNNRDKAHRNVQHINDLDKKDSTVPWMNYIGIKDSNQHSQADCGAEYNIPEAQGDLSVTENWSDSELFGQEGLFEHVEPAMSSHLKAAPDIDTQAHEEKTYNTDACFSFSKFRSTLMASSVHSEESLRDSHRPEFDELD